ncbi:MAG: GAF domain-containing protein [Thermomicrobiales bacterium]|nr:GAF domain-containing protein [Thermomicrobiales bacterium]
MTELPPSHQPLLAAYEAALDISAELDVDLVLQRVVDLARTVVPSHYAALGVCDAHGVIQQFITSGIDAETRAAIGPLPQGKGLLGVLIHDGEPLIVPDIAAHPRSVGFPPNHPPMRSMLGVPITLGERTLGDLYLTEPASGPYTQRDLEIVQILAAHAARAIERAQLYSAVEQGQRLAESQRDQLQVLLDSLPSGILIFSVPDAMLAMSNQTARDFIWGGKHSPHDVPLASLPYILLTLEGNPLSVENYPSRRAMRGETVRNAQLIMERIDGTRFPIFVQAQPLRDPTGQITQAIVVFQDITRLREAEQLKDDFLSLLSHEFRTPLTAINGGARLLAGAGDAIDAETRGELLHDIVTESKRLEQMLSNMLSVAAIMAGRLTPLAEPVLIEPIIRRVSSEVAAIAPNHRFVIQVQPGLPAAEGDADLLTQVMRNLYENAVKYAPQGGTVLTTAEADGDQVCVQVHDNGIGIAPEAVPDLFQRFRRAGANPTIRGMGLGLYLSRMLMEAQGGTISASSAGPGKGATFTIGLPVIREAVEEGT